MSKMLQLKHGIINISDICDVKYKPNIFSNHLFCNDKLYITFKRNDDNDYDPDDDCDCIIRDWDIINVVAHLDAYRVLSKNKINIIKQQILDRVGLFACDFRDSPECISVEEFLGNNYNVIVDDIKQEEK